ncbi:MAG: hypothetical protein ACREEB_06040 [Caulobacteraceae bacterium]
MENNKMRNLNAIAAVLAIGMLSAAATAIYTPDGSGNGASTPRLLAGSTAGSSGAATVSHISKAYLRVAQDQCIEHNQTCTINGTACCLSTDECTGKFPNTTCQAR